MGQYESIPQEIIVDVLLPKLTTFEQFTLYNVSKYLNDLTKPQLNDNIPITYAFFESFEYNKHTFATYHHLMNYWNKERITSRIYSNSILFFTRHDFDLFKYLIQQENHTPTPRLFNWIIRENMIELVKWLWKNYYKNDFYFMHSVRSIEMFDMLLQLNDCTGDNQIPRGFDLSVHKLRLFIKANDNVYILNKLIELHLKNHYRTYGPNEKRNMWVRSLGYAIKYDRHETIKYSLNNIGNLGNYRSLNSYYEVAIQMKNNDVCNHLFRKGLVLNDTLYEVALRHSNYEAFEWLLLHNCPKSTRASVVCGVLANHELLTKLADLQFPIDYREMMLAAISNNQLDFAKYAYKFITNENVPHISFLSKALVSSNNVMMMGWVIETFNIMPSKKNTEYLLCAMANCRHIDYETLLSHIIMQGWNLKLPYQISMHVLRTCVSANNVHLMKYLREFGFHLDKSMFETYNYDITMNIYLIGKMHTYVPSPDFASRVFNYIDDIAKRKNNRLRDVFEMYVDCDSKYLDGELCRKFIVERKSLLKKLKLWPCHHK